MEAPITRQADVISFSFGRLPARPGLVATRHARVRADLVTVLLGGRLLSGRDRVTTGDALAFAVLRHDLPVALASHAAVAIHL